MAAFWRQGPSPATVSHVTQMSHHYNRAAFQAGTSSTNLLLATYCSLVDLELAIKIHFWSSGWKQNHRIVDWVNNIGETSLATQLAGRLALLYCTSKLGTEVRVDANNYPTIRYLRHESDFAGKSRDTELRDLLNIISDIRKALRARGITI